MRHALPPRARTTHLHTRRNPRSRATRKGKGCLGKTGSSPPHPLFSPVFISGFILIIYNLPEKPKLERGCSKCDVTDRHNTMPAAMISSPASCSAAATHVARARCSTSRRAVAVARPPPGLSALPSFTHQVASSARLTGHHQFPARPAFAARRETAARAQSVRAPAPDTAPPHRERPQPGFVGLGRERVVQVEGRGSVLTAGVPRRPARPPRRRTCARPRRWRR